MIKLKPKNRFTYFTNTLVAIATVAALVLPSFAHAQDSPDPAFNPNRLIEDSVFSDTQTFGGYAGIQKFLESKGSVLANTTPEFLAKLKEPGANILKQALEDSNPTANHTRTAAELIWDAAQSSGMNPQVILVTLNKEQSLITGSFDPASDKVQKALDFSLGFGCPDGGGCGDLYRGFYFQLFGNLDSSGNRYLGAVKSLMRSFTTPGGRGPAVVNGVPAKVGDVITLDNTMGGYAGILPQQTITIGNNATAALYRYTPHVFNGNYNFWRFFNTWFRYANGTLIRISGDSNLYIIQNGARMTVPAFVAQARNLNVGAAISVSQNELQSYPVDKLYGPADNTIISVNGKLYVFIDNVKHPATVAAIQQRGLNAANAIAVSDSDAAVFTDGSLLTPAEGSVLRGTTNLTVYLVANDKLQAFTPFTFAQRNAMAKLQIIPDSEITTYPKEGFVPPLNGSVVKSSVNNTVYVIENGQRRGLTAELFRNRGLQYKDVGLLGAEETAALPEGSIATPKEGTYFVVPETKAVYLFKDGVKHPITAFVAQQRKMGPDFVFEASIAKNWTDGSFVTPKDDTVIKGDKNPTVYLVVSGQLRPLTYEAFVARKIVAKNIAVVSQGDVDAFPKGDVLTK